MPLIAPEADTWWERLSTMARPDHDRREPPRSMRRVAAVVAVLGYGVLMVVLDADLGPLGTIALVGGSLVAWFVALWVVYEFRRRLANAPDAALDEREIRVRDRAYLQAHRMSTAFLFVAGLAAGPLVSSLQVELSSELVIDVAFSLAMGLLALPAAVVAWTEPDDEVEPDVVTAAPATGHR